MRLPEIISLVAQSTSKLLDEVGVGVAIMLTLAGIALHLYRPKHLMSVEERVKDSRMTEEEARRQMKFLRLWAPLVTLIGVALLCLAIYDLGA